MTKADDEVITWILLCDAKALVAKVYPSKIAERFLVQKLIAGRIRWRGLESPSKNGKQGSDPGSGDSGFWKLVTKVGWTENWARHDVVETRINRVESWVRREDTMRRDRVIVRSYPFFRIELAREDVAELLPAVDLNIVLVPTKKPTKPTMTTSSKPPRPSALVKRAMEQLFPNFPAEGEWQQISTVELERKIWIELKKQGIPEDQMPSRATIERVLGRR